MCWEPAASAICNLPHWRKSNSTRAPSCARNCAMGAAFGPLRTAFVRVSKHNPVLQTLSGPAVLLVWLYVMANVIVLGAEVNWWRGNRALASDLA